MQIELTDPDIKNPSSSSPQATYYPFKNETTGPQLGAALRSYFPNEDITEYPFFDEKLGSILVSSYQSTGGRQARKRDRESGRKYSTHYPYDTSEAVAEALDLPLAEQVRTLFFYCMNVIQKISSAVLPAVIDS